MSDSPTDAAMAAFFEIHAGLPRQAPGSDGTTRRLLDLAGPFARPPRVLDLGCGPGRAALLLARETGGEVVGLDTHQPFLDELDAAGDSRIRTVNASMADPPFPDGSFDLLWAESSVYNIGFDVALRAWRRLLAPGGALVVTECEWARADPSAAAREFWAPVYPLRSSAENASAAESAGYRVVGVYPQPESDWWDEYYTPIEQRLAAADLDRPGMAEAVAAERVEIALRREHGGDYRYTGYVLRG
jgi:SAM-dependent methyltransferase